jgi:hypothetical protein
MTRATLKALAREITGGRDGYWIAWYSSRTIRPLAYLMAHGQDEPVAVWALYGTEWRAW